MKWESTPVSITESGARVATRERQTFALLLKRTIDMIGSSVGLIFLSPIFLLIAILVKLDSSGPVIFKQTRVGLGGRTFTFCKFRSMYENNDSSVHRKYIVDLIRGTARATVRTVGAKKVFKMDKDPRITRAGRVLRRTSLDELPQLFNVLKGDMSLVGPRPGLLYEVKMYKDWYTRRLTTIPGITGLWQVSGRSQRTFDEMVALDLAYIDNWSLWLDIKILLKTIFVVLSKQGAW